MKNSFLSVGIIKKRGQATSLFFSLLLFLSACGGGSGKAVYEEGEALREKKRYDAAIEKYRYVVLHFEKSEYAPEALFRIGEINYLYLHDFDLAVKSFRKLIGKYSWSDRCRLAQRFLAEIFMYKKDDFKQAIVEYEKAISYYGNSPESEQFQFEITKAYFNLKNYEQQRVELNLLLSRYPDTDLRFDVIYHMGNSYFVEGFLDEAIGAYKRIVDKSPHTPIAMEATFQMAACLEEKERLKEAMKLLREIEGIYPNPDVIKMRIERIRKRLKKRKRG